MTICNVKRAACNDKPTENDHPTAITETVCLRCFQSKKNTLINQLYAASSAPNSR